MEPVRRRVWPWIVVALLLLLLSGVLLLSCSPESADGKGVAYLDRDRWLILATGETGWLGLIFAIRAKLSRGGAGLLARAGRFVGWSLVAAGVALAALGGMFMSELLSSKVHGTPSSGGHHHHWD